MLVSAWVNTHTEYHTFKTPKGFDATLCRITKRKYIDSWGVQHRENCNILEVYVNGKKYDFSKTEYCDKYPNGLLSLNGGKLPLDAKAGRLYEDYAIADSLSS